MKGRSTMIRTAAVLAMLLIGAMAEAAVSKLTLSTRVGTIKCWVGDANANTITDSDNTNCVQGRAGRDTMRGVDGPDRMDGEYLDRGTTGGDTIYGGAGTDTFYVGPGQFWGNRAYADRIMDFQSGETLCTRLPIVSWWRTVNGTTGEHRYIVARDSSRIDTVLAWVASLGSKSIRVLGGCFLQNE